MEGPYLQSEPVASRREFPLFLVDETDLKTPETGEGGGQAQIRKAGETTWTNTDATLIHIGNGHYVLVLTAAELNTIGPFAIRFKSANTAEFQHTGWVSATSSEISLDEVNEKIDGVQARLRAIEFLVNKTNRATQPDPFISPL